MEVGTSCVMKRWKHRHECDVCRLDQFAAAPKRQAVDRSDNRLRKGFDAPRHSMTRPHEMRCCLGWSGVDMTSEFGDVSAGAEGASRAGDNDRMDSVVEFDVVEL
jgi:hypothetical protein